MADVLEKMIVEIGADMTELKEALGQSTEAAKKTAKAVSFTGVAARKAMLSMANSSTIANAYMNEFNAMVGIVADTILAQLAPAIEPIMNFLWELVDTFVNMDEKHKMVVAAIFAISAALYLISAHPVIAAIAGIIVLLYLMKKHWDEVTRAVNIILIPFKALWNIFEKINDVLVGHSLIPALRTMADIIKTVLMPQLWVMQTAFEGIKMIMSNLTSLAGSLAAGFTAAGTQITQNFTQVFNFLGSGFQNVQEKAEDAIKGIGSKIKSGLGF